MVTFKQHKSKRYLSKGHAIAMLLVLMLALCACGSPKNNADIEQVDSNVTSTTISYLSGGDISPFLIQSTEGRIFFVRETIKNERCIYSLECGSLGESKTEIIAALGENKPVSMSVRETGTDVIVSIVSYTDNLSLLVSDYNVSLGKVNEVIIEDERCNSLIINFHLNCGDGIYLFASNEEAISYDADSGRVKSLKSIDGIFIDGCVIDGAAYLSCYDASENRSCILEADMQAGRLEPRLWIKGNVSLIKEGDKNTIGALSDTCLYEYDLDTLLEKSHVPLSDYSFFDLSNIRDIIWKENVFDILYWKKANGSEARLYHIKDKVYKAEASGEFTKDGKRVIKLCDLSGVGKKVYGETIIPDFNVENDDYFVQLVEAPANENLAFTGNFDYDLICSNNSCNVERYYRSGILMDLLPLIDECEELDKDDLQEYVYSLYGYDEGLYGIPYRGTIETIFTQENLLSKDEVWSVDDFLTNLETNPNVISTYGLSKMNILKFVIEGSIDEYVDFEGKKAGFKANDFATILARIKTLRKLDESYNFLFFPSEVQKDREYIIAGNYDYASDYCYKEALIGKTIVNRGFPNNAGVFQMNLTDYATLSISSRCECRKGAMEFIKYVLYYPYKRINDDDIVNSTGLDGTIWPLKAACEAEFAKAEGKHIVNYANMNETYVEYEISKEKLEYFMRLINEAKVRTAKQEDVLHVIYEESEAYLNGDKSVEEVCEIIESRVSIIISE